MGNKLLSTHEVTNQPPPFGGHNAYDHDPLLKRITAALSPELKQGLTEHGSWAGSHDAISLGALANREKPVLNTHDAMGNRLDQVEFHPSYHALMRRSAQMGLHCSIWEEGQNERGVRNLTRAARFYLTSQVECGHLCPITMTNASVAALSASPQLASEWLPLIKTRSYDPSQRAPSKKTALTIGMGMTEKQGGSDVRMNTSSAEPLENGLWSLTGHKWFMSAPMCDAFLTLAQTKNGLSCFLVPRLLPDGSANGLRFQRLKDKLGNQSNASSEVEFAGILGQLVGEEGAGIATILQMVTLTRLDCAVNSSALMRVTIANAVHHAHHRAAFGNTLIDQPLMVRVLADLSLDMAAATALSMRLALAYDRAASDEGEAAYARLMTPVVKYWVCKSVPAITYEAMESLGGNGYVETGNMARHYREAPLNAIWEGSGNLMALDLLRVFTRQPATLDYVLSSIAQHLGGDGQNKTVDVIRSAAQMASGDPGSARILVEQLALTAAAAELHRLALGDVAAAFTETRLGGLWRSTYGMLDNRYDARMLVDTLFPQT